MADTAIMSFGNSELGKIGNNQIANWRERLTVQSVDQLADELANEYGNPLYRKWYCKLIYGLGPLRIDELRGRAKDANNPGKLFSKLAKSELASKEAQGRLNA